MLIKFIKENYLLVSKSLDDNTKDFLAYYYRESKDKSSKQRIGRELRKIGISPKQKSDGLYYYIKSHDELLAEYKKQN